MRLTRIGFEWKLADLWVGAFWKWTPVVTDAGPVPAWLDVWVCLVPCLPLHLTFARDVPVEFGMEGGGG